MKQVLQSLKDGRTKVADVPRPEVGRGQLLIASSRTLVSPGTERMLVDFGKAGLLGKARQQPDKLRLTLQKMRTDGLLPTIEAVVSKLDQPLPLGYCNVGVVLQCGEGVSGFHVGDRVVSNGAHAEIVACAANLCARVPDGVSDDDAAFTVLGAIALQGIRLAKPTLGEAVVVIGLGLVGLLTVQLLRANGCRVLALDLNQERIDLARRFGAQGVDAGAHADAVAAAEAFSRSRGVDAVIVTAATQSSEPIRLAATMCRKRGRIVLVGTSGLELSRADFYEKELSFQVSCSYGPGRYDPSYEEQGVDYPIGYVRWTEQRNFEAILDQLASERLDTAPLVTHRFAIEEAPAAYELMVGGPSALGILLEYPQAAAAAEDRSVRLEDRSIRAPASAGQSAQGCRVAFIGSGNYATRALIPAFQSAGGRLSTIASRGGVSGASAARKFRFEVATTDLNTVFDDPNIDLLVICTRHDTHADFVIRALEHGKDVFVEKPLALSEAEVDAIERQLSATSEVARRPLLTVGFNRRFAPQIVRMKRLLDARQEPKTMIMTINAGSLPNDHWLLDPKIGGGRIVGEGCHFVDLCRFLADSPIVSHRASPAIGRSADSATIALTFADGSTGVINYLANGSKSFPKERIEVFCDGGVLQLDNFRVLKGFGWPGFRSMKLWRQDKGQKGCAKAFLDACQGDRVDPVPVAELLEVARVSISLGRALRA